MNPSQRLQSVQIKLFDRLDQMILPTGIIQHGKLEALNMDHPSSIDDNARAAIVLARFSNEFPDQGNMKVVFDYMRKSKRKDGFVNNYRNWDGKFIGRKGKVEKLNTLYDCFGRYLWTLSEIAQSDYPQAQEAKKLFLNSVDQAQGLKDPMSKALTMIGLSKFPEQTDCPSDKIVQINNHLSYELSKLFKKYSDKNWKGFSNEYTYCAARPAQALILAGDKLNHRALIKIGRESLDFLTEKTIQNNQFNAIGNQGFLKRGEEIPTYDQQPIEAGVMIEGLIDTYKVTGEQRYLDNALTCFSWFHGNNIQNVEMIAENGGIYDAITPSGVNLNQGAESIISYMLSLSKFKDIKVNPFEVI